MRVSVLECGGPPLLCDVRRLRARSIPGKCGRMETRPAVWNLCQHQNPRCIPKRCQNGVNGIGKFTVRDPKAAPAITIYRHLVDTFRQVGRSRRRNCPDRSWCGTEPVFTRQAATPVGKPHATDAGKSPPPPPWLTFLSVVPQGEGERNEQTRKDTKRN